MVQRALSHRRGTRALELDTTTTTASPSTPYVTIPVIVRTGSSTNTAGRRESLPFSRHHLMRRSSSVSSRSTVSSSSSSSGFDRGVNGVGVGVGRGAGVELYDGGSVIVDSDDVEEPEGLVKRRGEGEGN
jgi:hypothetical protein